MAKKKENLIPLIKKSNALARARWEAQSIWEPRLVALLASKIKWDDEDFAVYEIHVSELFGQKYGGREIKELEKAVNNAMSRVLTIKDSKGWSKYNLFSRCRFRSDEGILELGFHPDLKQHYLQLKMYVKYNLVDFLKLPSVYSQRLFEILKSWSDKPEVIIPIAELHEMLATPASQQKDFRQFRIRVLEKVQADMKKYVNFKFEWLPIKQGRAVTSIRFIFTRLKMADAEEKRHALKEKEDREKSSAEFLKYVVCYSMHGIACEGGHENEAVCQICRRLR